VFLSVLIRFWYWLRRTARVNSKGSARVKQRKRGATRWILLMAHLKVRPTKIDKSTAKARGNGAASGRRGARTVFGTAKAVP
jgi:hypothetical protein